MTQSEETPFDESQNTPTPEEIKRNKRFLYGGTVGFIIILATLIVSIYFLLQPTTDTARLRDIFIIFLAVESLLLGLALVVLIVQLARLINLLQNEIKPILDSTTETVSTLRGTTTFLSNNLVEPVLKLNEYLASFKKLFKLIGVSRGKDKNN